MTRPICEFCLERPSGRSAFMCDPCGRAYDRAQPKLIDALSAMIWSAQRARRFERRRQRAPKCVAWERLCRHCGQGPCPVCRKVATNEMEICGGCRDPR